MARRSGSWSSPTCKRAITSAAIDMARPLQAHNGRDPLVDAYQEALDLVVYLRQAIEERRAP